jgi:hypothetical protein
MRIVCLKREAKPEDIAVAEQSVVFKGPPPVRVLPRLLTPFRKKRALNNDPTITCQNIVHRLETKVRHRDPVMVRIGQMKTDIAGAVAIRNDVTLKSLEFAVSRILDL